MKKLKRNLNDLYSRAREFVNKLKDEDRILLIHHTDLDGAASAVLFQKFLEKNGVEPTKVVSWSNELGEDEIEEIGKFDKIVVLDIDISYMWKILFEMDKEILLIDHHPPVKDMNTEKIVYMNPRLVNERIYQPTSYLVWKISEDDQMEWLAIVGTVGDSGFRDCKDLLEKKMKAETIEEARKTKYAKAAFRLNAALTQIGFEKVRGILLKINSFEELDGNEEINGCWKKYLEEYNKIKKKFWKNLVEHKKIKLMVSNVGEVQRPLTSSLATELSYKYQDKIIVLLRDEGDKVAVNSRFQNDGIHLGNLLRKVSEGLDGGGGHDHAAGATIKKKDIDLFLSRLVKEL
ncbi:MAG: DHHA1 domain-containing protein, partial [Candidatus Aenigmatarchaeota archaeon]